MTELYRVQMNLFAFNQNEYGVSHYSIINSESEPPKYFDINKANASIIVFLLNKIEKNNVKSLDVAKKLLSMNVNELAWIEKFIDRLNENKPCPIEFLDWMIK